MKNGAAKSSYWHAAKAGIALLCLGFSTAPAMAGTWQCAPFARMISGIQLFGKAASWWAQSTGKYAQGQQPKPGSVLVFKAIDRMRAGHVATVSEIVSDRAIKVTHANWSVINGKRGQVEKNVLVIDASEKGDWSKVRVWYAGISDVGIKAYPTYGFIYAPKSGAAPKDAGVASPEKAPETLVAQRETADAEISS